MQSFFGFAAPANVDIGLSNTSTRRYRDGLALGSGLPQRHYIYCAGDDIVGDVKVGVVGGKRLEHLGVKIELKGVVGEGATRNATARQCGAAARCGGPRASATPSRGGWRQHCSTAATPAHDAPPPLTHTRAHRPALPLRTADISGEKGGHSHEFVSVVRELAAPGQVSGLQVRASRAWAHTRVRAGAAALQRPVLRSDVATRPASRPAGSCSRSRSSSPRRICRTRLTMARTPCAATFCAPR